MKGFLQEYGLIIVVVAVILLMLLFGKSGYAKSIQNAILGSADYIVETGENITKKEPGDILKIEGKEYVVLDGRKNSQALVMTASSIGDRAFQSKARSDGQNMSTYEGSEIDNYLENDWYNSLSSAMKIAIQQTNIKQTDYSFVSEGNFKKEETGPNGQIYNSISRHVFLPSISELEKLVDFKNKDEAKAFYNKNGAGMTRDSNYIWSKMAWGYTWSRDDGSFYGMTLNNFTEYSYPTYPTFVIDLSKVDYTEAGHVDYK